MESPSANSQKHKKLPTEAAIYSIQELSIILKMDKEPMFSITPSSIKKKYDNTAATNHAENKGSSPSGKQSPAGFVSQNSKKIIIGALIALFVVAPLTLFGFLLFSPLKKNRLRCAFN